MSSKVLMTLLVSCKKRKQQRQWRHLSRGCIREKRHWWEILSMQGQAVINQGKITFGTLILPMFLTLIVRWALLQRLLVYFSVFKWSFISVHIQNMTVGYNCFLQDHWTISQRHHLLEPQEILFWLPQTGAHVKVSFQRGGGHRDPVCWTRLWHKKMFVGEVQLLSSVVTVDLAPSSVLNVTSSCTPDMSSIA